MTLIETNDEKQFVSDDYNYYFNKHTGFFIRWGKTSYDDPVFSHYGPEIADIEISTICHGGCKFCYKSNQPTGVNMSFPTFKKICNKLPSTVTQIAFGIGDIDGNPDLWSIMVHARERGIIPNITINGSRMKPKYYDSLTLLCGAVSVSLYNYETCYNAVKELTSRGLKQTNIHCLLSKETYDKCMRAIHDYHNDPRLSDLNAIVFLWLKPVGYRNTYHQVTSEMFKNLVARAEEFNVPFGFDSCSAGNFVNIVGDKYNTVVESCESTLFSLYINVEGKAFPCSFCENVNGYNGVDVLSADDFINDVWFSDDFVRFRESVILNTDKNKCRMCPIYNLRCD